MEGYSGALRRDRRTYSGEYVELALIYYARGSRCHLPKAPGPLSFNANNAKAAAKQQPEPFFIIPLSRDPLFLGREDVIGLVDIKFKSERRVALTGIGGVG